MTALKACRPLAPALKASVFYFYFYFLFISYFSKAQQFLIHYPEYIWDWIISMLELDYFMLQLSRGSLPLPQDQLTKHSSHSGVSTLSDFTFLTASGHTSLIFSWNLSWRSKILQYNFIIKTCKMICNARPDN